MAGIHLTLVRTKLDGADDAAPNVVPPAANSLFYPPSLRQDTHSAVEGVRGKLVFDDPLLNSADIELWVRNETDNTWIYAGTLSAVHDSEMFLTRKTGDGVVYFRLVNVSAGNPIQIWAECA